MIPTIVISAYNRPVALRRLLLSLRKAVYPGDHPVRLVISIDRGNDSGHTAVVDCAREFEWRFGTKEIIEHDEHLGLVQHVFFCCGLTQSYDEIIYLEDDLIVSPAFYTYASQAFEFYRDDKNIASISLYGLWFNGYTQQPFVPLSDGSDIFFLQMPYTQGQAFNRSQWEILSAWLASGNRRLSPTDHLHDSFFHFGPEEWFPAMAKYVVENGLYIVYPRISLTSGAGDAGTHFEQPSVFFQTPLQGIKSHFHFSRLNESISVYDSFFELLPNRLNRLTDSLGEFDYDVDLYATKRPRHIHADHVLTSRRCRYPIKSFGKTMWPLEANIIENEPGAEIFFCRTQDLKWDTWSELAAQKSNFDFFTRHRRMSRRLQFKFALYDFLKNFFHLQ